MTRRFFLVASVLGFLIGCLDAGPRKHPFTGEVTLDGKPLKEGGITFRPRGGKGTPEGGKIADGKYAVNVADGDYDVLINASKPGKEVPGMGTPMVEALPDRYHTKTTLEAKVSGPGTQNFTLTSQ